LENSGVELMPGQPPQPEKLIKASLIGHIICCSNGHQNGPTARFCWKCGEFLQGSVKNRKEAGVVKKVPYEGSGGHPVVEIDDRPIIQDPQGSGLYAGPGLEHSVAECNTVPRNTAECDEDPLIRAQASLKLLCGYRGEMIALSFCLKSCTSHLCVNSEEICELSKKALAQVNAEKAIGMS
jgi:hypothetical protein